MAVMGDFGVNGTGILQPKLKNRWRLTFLGFGDGVVDGDSLQVQAISFNRPKFTIAKITQDRYNSTAYIGGKYKFDPTTVTIVDDTGGQVSIAIQNQLEKQQRLIGLNSAPMLPASPAGQLYKFAMRADMLDGNETIFESWAYEGMWISDPDYGAMDYGADEQVKITLTLTYDLARQSNTGIIYNSTSNSTINVA